MTATRIVYIRHLFFKKSEFLGRILESKKKNILSPWFTGLILQVDKKDSDIKA